MAFIGPFFLLQKRSTSCCDSCYHSGFSQHLSRHHTQCDNFLMLCSFIQSADGEIPAAPCWGPSVKEQRLLCWGKKKKKKTYLERYVLARQPSRAEDRVGEDNQTTSQKSLWIVHCVIICISRNYSFQASQVALDRGNKSRIMFYSC